ncbi:hypothetical protein YC2023_044730 [Brassica napus]
MSSPILRGPVNALVARVISLVLDLKMLKSLMVTLHTKIVTESKFNTHPNSQQKWVALHPLALIQTQKSTGYEESSRHTRTHPTHEHYSRPVFH